MSGQRNCMASQLVLLDVIPLSLGIEVVGKVMATVVKRNTSIPVRKSDEFTTESDYSESIDVVIFEGERTCTDGNNKLGEFTISGIQRAKRGVPKIEVTFNVDANGILTVTAKDKVTGAANEITIVAKGRNSKADVERMLAEAEQFKKQDEEFKKRAESKNALESLISQMLDIAQATSNESLEEAAKDTRKWLEEHEDDKTIEAELFDKKARWLERKMEKA